MTIGTLVEKVRTKAVARGLLRERESATFSLCPKAGLG
jgi:hypothetical protein